jgi:hypothetical protein
MEGTARIWFTPQERAELWERDAESRRVHLQFVMKRPLAKRGSSSSSIFDWLGFSGG